MARDATRPIIIKKVIEEVHGGHHGGAWKVAYADFVTAMMAFFLLLWLISSASEDTKKGLSEYFSDSGENRVNEAVKEGAVTGTTILTGQAIFQIPAEPFSQTTMSVMQQNQGTSSASGDDWDSVDPFVEAADEPISDDRFEEERQRREQEQFEDAKAAILERLSGSAELAEFKDNLVIKPTPEGLRVEILDRHGLAMFPSASDQMYEHTRQLLQLVVQAIADLPQKISIEGHTDARPFPDHVAYDNWKLSTDRAHATRKELVRSGLNPGRLAEVIGKGDADLLLPEAPDDPRNRRISVLLLRDQPVDESVATETSDASPTESHRN
ncbi:MAG: flagellar motor protein MotB [Pseudomonadota bacterium]